MNILVVIAPPNKGSFNHAIADTAIDALKKNGHEVVFRDLYEDNFDPILKNNEIVSEDDLPSHIKEQCEELANADGVIVVHPNWWGMPPAIMKGWIDRVFRTNYTHSFVGGAKGLMKAHAAIVFTTANTPLDVEDEVYGDPLKGLWEKCIFGLCGVKNVCRVPFASVIMSTAEQRKDWLTEVEATVNKYFS